MEDVCCFGGNPLDRASERRDDRDWITRLGDPQTRLLPLRESVRSFAETRWAGPTTLGTGTRDRSWRVVGSRTGAVPRKAPLGCIRRFQLRARVGLP
jgi:hypothetical protein